MNNLIDFTNLPDGMRHYGGSDNKCSRKYNGEKYLIKLPEVRSEKLDNLQTSHINNVLSEYIGSRIIASLGIPTHDTFLVNFGNSMAVACKDFRYDGFELHEFDWFMRSTLNKSAIGKIPSYNQLYSVIENNPVLSSIKEKALERYWETFVADALIGNFDRHKGNWGYLINEDTCEIKLAPVYDCGSCLYPGLSEDGMKKIMHDPEEIHLRLFEFPKAALNMSDNPRKTQKLGYWEALSSGFDKYCNEAFMRIYPKINIAEIHKIIEQTPALSDTRIEFYKTMLSARKELILDRAYEISRQYTGMENSQQEYQRLIDEGIIMEHHTSQDTSIPIIINPEAFCSDVKNNFVLSNLNYKVKKIMDFSNEILKQISEVSKEKAEKIIPQKTQDINDFCL